MSDSDIAIDKISQITKALEDAKEAGIDVPDFDILLKEVDRLKQQQMYEYEEEYKADTLYDFLKIKMEKRNGKIDEENDEEQEQDTDYVL